MLEIDGRVRVAHGDPLVDGQPLAHQFARRLFLNMPAIVPDIRPENPLRVSWVSDLRPGAHATVATFEFRAFDKRFRVTVEDIEEPPWSPSDASFQRVTVDDPEAEVRKDLARMRAAPLLYAMSRGAFVAEVATMLKMVGIVGPVERHLHLRQAGGNDLVRGGLLVDREFAERVVDEAIRLLNETEPASTP